MQLKKYSIIFFVIFSRGKDIAELISRAKTLHDQVEF